MADRTEIAWCDSTFNSWIGCTKVGPGCDNCYAEADFDLRRHRAKWGAGQERSRTSASNWKLPLRWNSQHWGECRECGWRGTYGTPSAPRCGRCGNPTDQARRRVFCASLADVFDNEVAPQWRADLFALIEKTPNLDWLLLTKRIGNVGRMLPDRWSVTLPPNVWIGATIVNQSEADRDIPKLLAIKAAVRFVSMEPLLGPVDLHRWINPVARVLGTLYQSPFALSWVIVGGESGPRARPIHPEWVRSLRDQCKAADVPFLFKQWGEWLPAGQDGNPGHDPFEINASDSPVRIGKAAAGRLLDGIEHNAFPEPRP